MGTVSRVYGDALMEAAREKNKTDCLTREAEVLGEIWKANPELPAFLENPNVTEEEKVSVLKGIFEERVSPEMMGFLLVILHKGRQKAVPDILDAFLERVMEEKKTGTAWVISAAELTMEQKEQVRGKLLASTSWKEFQMHFAVDPSLIGGMVIRVGDRVADSSIRTQLRTLGQSLQQIRLD